MPYIPSDKFFDLRTEPNTLHQTNLKCLKSGPLLKKQFFWQKLVKMSFLGKMIDIERRDFKKKFQKR